MPTWIISIVQTVLGLIFGPKDDPTAEAEKAGAATQQAADADASLKNIQTAANARENIREELAKNPKSVKDDDGFRRD